MAAPAPEDLAATEFIDADSQRVREFASRAIAGAEDDGDRVRRLFAAVRDRIRYDPYSLSLEPESYVASNVLDRGAAYCVPKAVVLAAAARSIGIPARVGFADVRNHLQSERLAAMMGTDLFIYHGYTSLCVDGAWRKATPAFNAELCARFGVPPLEFDGSGDALLHAFTGDGSRHMEYVRDHGTFADLPLAELVQAFRETYPGMAERLSSVDDPAFAGPA